VVGEGSNGSGGADGVSGAVWSTGTDSSTTTLTETGTASGGAFTQTVVGADSYVGSTTGNTANQELVGSVTGTGTWTRTSSGPGSTKPSGTGTNTFTHTTTENPIAGVFGQTLTGETRYQLVQSFDDVSNANAGSNPGHVKFKSHGLMFRDPIGRAQQQKPQAQVQAIPLNQQDGPAAGAFTQAAKKIEENYAAQRKLVMQEFESLKESERAEYLHEMRERIQWLKYLKSQNIEMSEEDFETSSFSGMKDQLANKVGKEAVIGLMIEKYGAKASNLLWRAEKLGFKIDLHVGGLLDPWIFSSVSIDRNKREIKIQDNLKLDKAAQKLFELLESNLSDEWVQDRFKALGLRNRHGIDMSLVDADLDRQLDELEQLWAAEVALGANATQDFLKEIAKDQALNALMGGAPHLLRGLQSLRKFKNKVDDWCFAADTLVHTEFGCKPIIEIQPLEKVWAYAIDSQSWSLQEVLHRSTTEYSGTIIYLTTEKERIVVTINHPIWVISGEDLGSRPVTQHHDVSHDLTDYSRGRWVDSHEIRLGDVLLNRDGSTSTITGIESAKDTLVVCNLTVRDTHTYAVGINGILVHNESWCNILAKIRPEPQALKDKLAKLNAARPKGKQPLKLHGHHIVMKEGQRAADTRKILLANNVEILDTKAAFNKAAKNKDAPNIAYAINGADGIHGQKYADAVHKRILESIKGKNTIAERKAAIEEELREMGKILERGEIFW
jgi:Pretoxin HINT domain